VTGRLPEISWMCRFLQRSRLHNHPLPLKTSAILKKKESQSHFALSSAREKASWYKKKVKLKLRSPTKVSTINSISIQ
jgi:hypothetical protein